LIARKLKGLSDLIDVTVVEPELGDQGGRFATPDLVNGKTYMHEIYTLADPAYTGRATVPVLWDRRTDTIASNESTDIVRMFNSAFGSLASGPDLYPADLAVEIDAPNDRIYPRLNNGVYRAGFATTQVAYDAAFHDVFAQLDELEDRLSDGRIFLFGDRFTESDIRLFVTTVRFDAAYHGLFKANLRRIADYPHLSRHLRAVLALPGVRETVSIDLGGNPDLSDPSQPVATQPGRFRRSLSVVAEAADIESRRLLQWPLAWTGLSAA
jgi:putative glutathione S-transferase